MIRYISEFRDGDRSKKLLEAIFRVSKKPVSLMEVCGTHTVAISRFGLRNALPETITLISGPGCPVCVTANSDIDIAIVLAQKEDVIFTTFGDMMKVPGSYSSLAKEKAAGSDIRVCYSTLDALKIAEENPEKKVVFFGVGFETTTPTIAMSLVEAKRRKLPNYFVFSAHKLVPPAMKALLDLGEVKLDGFICPGHVSAIIGTRPYEFVARDYKIPCVVTGFEPVDVLNSILMLVKQAEEGVAKVENEYSRTVRTDGNPIALKVMEEVFEVSDSNWRGIGVIPGSGLKLGPSYLDFDAAKFIDPREIPPTKEPVGCQCGEILRGVKFPYECRLFGKACTPEEPVGPCMVSSEGACAAYYRYGNYERT